MRASKSWQFHALMYGLVLVVASKYFSLYFPLHCEEGTVTNESSDSNPTAVNDEDFCLTPECTQTASMIVKNMDRNVDPCENFYRYACGGFINDSVLFDNEGSLSSFVIVHKKVQEEVKLSIQTESQPNEPKHFKLVKSLYKACMKTTAIDATNFAPIMAILRESGGWPVIDGDSWNEHGFDWKSSIHKLREAGFSFDYLITFEIDANPKNTTDHVIFLGQPSLGIDHAYLSQGLDNEVVSAYYNEMLAFAVMLGADKTRAEKELKASLIFETKLAKFSLPIEERRNGTLLYNPMTLWELSKMYPSIRWKEYLRGLLPLSIILEENELVIVTEPLYIANFAKLISQTPKRIQANYVMWRAAKTIARYVNDYIRDKDGKESNVLAGNRKRMPRAEECVPIVAESLPNIIGAMYVRKYFDRRSKQNVAEMVEDMKKTFIKILNNVRIYDYHLVTNGRALDNRIIKNPPKREEREERKNVSFRKALPLYRNLVAGSLIFQIPYTLNYIKQSDWMDKTTRERALDKVAAIISHIAYPDELLDDATLERFYKKLRASENHYFESILNIALFNTEYSLGKLRKPLNKTEWISHGKSAVVNAFYSAEDNSIRFAAGVLQGTLFNNDRPKYMNYGAIGYVIGHELTHGFDDIGKQFDRDGNLVNWWTPSTEKNYLQRKQCIIQQYLNYRVEELDLKLNSLNTQRENIADNGGVKIAYLAYTSWASRNKAEKKLPGIEMTPKQMFWLSAANMWCTKYTLEDLRSRVISDLHSPSEFRVVGPFSNMPEFANDFKCPVGSRMNPKEKCSFW